MSNVIIQTLLFLFLFLFLNFQISGQESSIQLYSFGIVTGVAFASWANWIISRS